MKASALWLQKLTARSTSTIPHADFRPLLSELRHQSSLKREYCKKTRRPNDSDSDDDQAKDKKDKGRGKSRSKSKGKGKDKKNDNANDNASFKRDEECETEYDRKQIRATYKEYRELATLAQELQKDGIEASISTFLEFDEEVTNAITAYVQEKASYAKKEASITRRREKLETKLSDWHNGMFMLDDNEIRSLYDNLLKTELFAQFYFVDYTPNVELEAWFVLVHSLV